jgi:hypothetical protein
MGSCSMGEPARQAKGVTSPPLSGADQHLFGSERSVSNAKGQVTLQSSAEFVRTYDAQAHELADAISAVLANTQAALNWLAAEEPDLEEVRRALIDIASAGMRAAETFVLLRAIAKKVSMADGVLDH